MCGLFDTRKGTSSSAGLSTLMLCLEGCVRMQCGICRLTHPVVAHGPRVLYCWRTLLSGSSSQSCRCMPAADAHTLCIPIAHQQPQPRIIACTPSWVVPGVLWTAGVYCHATESSLRMLCHTGSVRFLSCYHICKRVSVSGVLGGECVSAGALLSSLCCRL